MSTWVLLLVVALVALGPVIICLRHPLTVTLPAFAALVPFGGLISVTSAPAEGSNMWARFGSLSSLLGVLLAIGLLLQLVAGRRVSVRMSATVPLWLLFLGAAAATSLWSLDPVKTGNGLLSLGSLSIVYIFLALSEINRQIVHRVEQGLVFGGVAVSCYGLFQLAVLGGFPNDVAGIPSDGGGRFGNDMLGPNNEAVALLLPLMICLHRSVTRKEAQSRHFNMFLCALMFLGIVMTGSRGGIIAASVSLIALIVYSSKGRQKLATYLAIGLIAGGVAFFMHPFGLAEREVQTTSTSGRTDIWRVGFAACPQYCPFGSGWETFPNVYAKTQPKVPDAAVLVGKGGSYQPHNVIMLVAIELGLPGLILLFTVLGTTLSEALRIPRALRGPPLAALIGTYTASLFLSNLEFKFFWMALFMVALYRNMSFSEDPTVETTTPRLREPRLVERKQEPRFKPQADVVRFGG
jgi:hypothetical protein